MKKLTLLFATATVIAVVFFACQKDAAISPSNEQLLVDDNLVANSTVKNTQDKRPSDEGYTKTMCNCNCHMLVYDSEKEERLLLKEMVVQKPNPVLITVNTRLLQGRGRGSTVL
ncbi:MAG: hypothetical protein COA57_02890 [Flavobacteriales bacterium]|nr:MAG: hypothetical protein COA57_02890 [Flavobacteriales bacterium]